MKLTCYYTGKEPVDIRPAQTKRAWMDETPEGFAYRCLPLTIANAHGWEIGSPCDFEAIWDGGVGTDSLTILTKTPGVTPPVSHFGSGILTFHVDALFHTDPGYNLYVSGPANTIKDGIAPLTGIMETDWSPYTFTMNWRFTRYDKKIRFAKGEPICTLFPMPRGLVEDTEPVMRSLRDNPELQEQFKAWGASRDKFNEGLRSGDEDAVTQKWQKLYYSGKYPDGEKRFEPHQIKLRLKPFVEEK